MLLFSNFTMVATRLLSTSPGFVFVRDCCAQEESSHSGCDANADVCCDTSDACCKQACCQSDLNPEQSESASDGCKDECYAVSGHEEQCDSIAESCCEEECCGKEPQRGVTFNDTLAGETCCEGCYEGPSNNGEVLTICTVSEEGRCCDDCYDCERPSTALPPVNSRTDTCCQGSRGPLSRGTAPQSTYCEGEGCDTKSTEKCCEKICCGTDFCQCQPTADYTVPYLAPKAATSRDSQPGGGCNGPGNDKCPDGCCADPPKERLLMRNTSCHDSQADLEERPYVDDCCQSGFNARDLPEATTPSPCQNDCCDDGNECDYPPKKPDPCCEDSCCSDGDVAEEPETTVTIHTDNTQKVVLSIKGMMCAGCVATAERRLKATEGVESYKISLITTKAEIFYDKRKLTPQDIVDAINALSFTATLESAALRVNLTCDAIEATLQEFAAIVNAIDGVDSVAVNEEAVESCWMPKQSATDSVTVSYDPATIGIRALIVRSVQGTLSLLT